MNESKRHWDSWVSKNYFIGHIPRQQHGWAQMNVCTYTVGLEKRKSVFREPLLTFALEWDVILIILDNQHPCPLLQRDTVFSKAVYYTSVLKRTAQSKGIQCLCCKTWRKLRGLWKLTSKPCTPCFYTILGSRQIFLKHPILSTKLINLINKGKTKFICLKNHVTKAVIQQKFKQKDKVNMQYWPPPGSPRSWSKWAEQIP